MHGAPTSAADGGVSPWVAVGPVVLAVRLLERMTGTSPLLFDLTEHGWYDRHRRNGYQHELGLWSTSCGAVTFGHAMRTRLRRDSNPARPSIWRSGILMRSTCPRHPSSGFARGGLGPHRGTERIAGIDRV